MKLSNNIKPLNISTDPLTFVQVDYNTKLLTGLECIAEYSFDDSRCLIPGRSKARYFYEPSLGDRKIRAMLSCGYNNNETLIWQDDDDHFTSSCIKTMSPPNSVLKEVIHGCDFVLGRGTLLNLMTSCYASGPYSVGMKLVCCKFKDVYFIREYYTNTKISKEATMSEKHNRWCYEAHKFKQIVTTKCEGMKPDFNEAVSNKPNFIGMFKATLNAPSSPNNNQYNQSFSLFYVSAIDCIMPSSGQYLGLKTQYKEFGFGAGSIFKILKWWAQTYLIGTKKLAVGYHEKSRLNQVSLLDLDEMVNYLSLSGVNVNCCFILLYNYLQAVKNNLDMATEGSILVTERLPTSTEFTFKLLEEGSASETIHQVLPNKFKDHNWR